MCVVATLAVFHIYLFIYLHGGEEAPGGHRGGGAGGGTVGARGGGWRGDQDQGMGREGV